MIKKETIQVSRPVFDLHRSFSRLETLYSTLISSLQFYRRPYTAHSLSERLSGFFLLASRVRDTGQWEDDGHPIRRFVLECTKDTAEHSLNFRPARARNHHLMYGEDFVSSSSH